MSASAMQGGHNYVFTKTLFVTLEVNFEVTKERNLRADAKKIRTL